MPFFKNTVTYLLGLFLIFSSPIQAAERLLFSVDLIRHGDRAPIAAIPNSPNHWPQGYGVLTALGVAQEKKLGEDLRLEYVNKTHLLNTQYVPGSMYVRSTSVPRTTESIRALLSGLYPPGPDVPIDIPERQQDKLLLPEAGRDMKELKKCCSEIALIWDRYAQKHQQKLALWSHNAGLKLDTNANFIKLSDDLRISKLHQKPYPPGISSQDADEIIAAGISIMSEDFKLKAFTNLMGYEFLQTVDGYFNNRVKNKSRLRYVLFGGHDGTIMSIMNTLDVPLDFIPAYASRLNFSLYEQSKSYYVKISLNNKEILIPFCHKKTCTLEQFNGLSHSAH